MAFKISKRDITRLHKAFDKMTEDKILYPHLQITKEGTSEDKSEAFIEAASDYQLFTMKATEQGTTVTTRMRRGAGSEKDFNKKVEALRLLRAYAKRKKFIAYSKKESLENIKITTEDKVITLTYNPKSKTVVEKERARRGKKEDKPANEKHETIALDSTKEDKNIAKLIKVSRSSKPIETTIVTQDPADLINMERVPVGTTIITQNPTDLINMDAGSKTYINPLEIAKEMEAKEAIKDDLAKTEKPAKKRARKTEFKPVMDEFDKLGPAPHANKIIEDRETSKLGITKEKKYEFLEPETKVVNIYNNKTYKVVSDRGNVIEVFDSSTANYLIIARADLKVKKDKGGII